MNGSVKKGFTLIELLVVISIIGLLSSIVMAGLQSAREKARAGSIRSGVLQLANSLELHRAANGAYTGYIQPGGYFFDQADECKDGAAVSYGNKEFISDEGARICESILKNLPTDQASNDIGDLMVFVTADTYTIRAKLKDGLSNHYGTNWFCADSTGARRVSTYTSAGVCL